MTIELLQTMSTVSYVLAGLFLVISTVLFFRFQIPKVFSDLTGRTERRAIDAIRKQNEGMIEDAASGKTGRINKTDKLQKKENGKMNTVGHHETKERMTGGIGVTGELAFSETTVLEQAQETTVLQVDETVVLQQAYPMEQKRPPAQAMTRPAAVSGNGVRAELIIEVDLFFAESKEVIQ